MAMKVERRFLWMRAESFVHVGIGQVASLIDKPFVRESGSGYPYIPGSAMKGACRSAARVVVGMDGKEDKPEVLDLFGQAGDAGDEAAAGALLFSDARLLFLPLRSLDRGSLLVTCPALLERLHRSRRFAGAAKPDVPPSFSGLDGYLRGDVERAVFLTAQNATAAYVEQFRLPLWDRDATIVDPICQICGLEQLSPGEQERLLLISNGAFAHFARRGLHVRTRNHLDPLSKTVKEGLLWSEESLPPDSLLCAVISERAPRPAAGGTPLAADPIGTFFGWIDELSGYLQIGGNETVGEGWFHLKAQDLLVPEGGR